jgi:hypothetical protein
VPQVYMPRAYHSTLCTLPSYGPAVFVRCPLRGWDTPIGMPIGKPVGSLPGSPGQDPVSMVESGHSDFYVTTPEGKAGWVPQLCCAVPHPAPPLVFRRWRRRGFARAGKPTLSGTQILDTNLKGSFQFLCISDTITRGIRHGPIDEEAHPDIMWASASIADTSMGPVQANLAAFLLSLFLLRVSLTCTVHRV